MLLPRQASVIAPWTRQLAVAGEHLVDNIDQRPPLAAGLGPDPLEGLAVPELVALHEDALRALDLGPSLEGGQQHLVLLIALERHVDPSLELGLVRRVEI